MSCQLPAGSLTRTEEMRCGAGGPTSGEEEEKQQQQQQQLTVNNPGCDTETDTSEAAEIKTIFITVSCSTARSGSSVLIYSSAPDNGNAAAVLW